MKRERKCRGANLKLYEELDYNNDLEDTRYWGLFYIKKGNNTRVAIDPKRYKKQIGLSERQLNVIDNRRTHYFYPQKENYYDYNCNIFKREIKSLIKQWEEEYKPLIEREVSSISKPKELSPGDYHNLMCGISSCGAANAWANYQNMINEYDYKNKCAVLINSLYSQFFHLITSRIEAVTIKVLAKNNVDVKRFDRNKLYGNMEDKIKELEHFQDYDKTYCLWHFIKHNSLSTYETLKERYPEVLNENKYEHGDLSIYFVNFSEQMIMETLNNCQKFFDEYCALVFKEKIEESDWNYDQYFINAVDSQIEDYRNPLGLQWWDDID